MIEQGTQVGGFRIERLLGRGGMASVYYAVQVRLDRPVALKILEPALALDEKFVERFKLEGINAARLDHPNIVPVYEAGEDGGYAFLAMKLIDGESFAAKLAREHKISLDDALGILTPVAHALDHAHSLGFIHRDIKPGNILIHRSGHVFLSDFGLSKYMGSRGITRTGQWMGTAEYMAPEQAAGRAVDHRADLYSLGCVAFECLTGEPPFLDESPFAVMMAHANAEIPQVVHHDDTLSPSIDLVLHRAMAKDPAHRYPAALAFVESLGAAAHGEPLTAYAEPADGYRVYEGEPTAPSVDRAMSGAEVSWPMSAPPSDQGVRPHGGSPSNPICPQCMSVVYADDVFCGGCGSKILWCPSCGGARVASDRFCSHCGATSDAVEDR